MATYEEAKSALLTCQANRTFENYGKVVSLDLYHDNNIDSNFLKVVFEKGSLKNSLVEPVFVGVVKVIVEETVVTPVSPFVPKVDNVPPASSV